MIDKKALWVGAWALSTWTGSLGCSPGLDTATYRGVGAYKADVEQAEMQPPSLEVRPPPSAPPALPAPSLCELQWQKDIQFGTAQEDEATSLAMDARRNIYLAGYLGGRFGITTLEPGGNSRAFVTKYRATGERAWQQEIDTGGTDTAEAVGINPKDQNIVLVGRTTGALLGARNAGQFDLFLQTMLPDGTALHALQFGDEYPQHPRVLAFDDNGNAYVEGFNDIYVMDRSVVRLEDETIVKFSYQEPGLFASVPVWSSMSIAPQSDPGTGMAIARGRENAIYTANATILGSSLQQRTLDNSSVWLRKINSFAPDQITGIAVDSAGNAIVVGATSEKLGQARFGLQDVYVAKIDRPTGSVSWVTQVGTAVGDWPSAVTVNEQGQIFVVGRTAGSLMPGYMTAGPLDADLFALRLASDGTLERVWQRGSFAAEDVPTGLVADACGSVFISGYTVGALVPSAMPQGGRDGFLVRISPTDWRSP